MRYHVISLVAVLLALGIGILLGTTLVERGLIAEQRSEIDSLRETFSEIRETNREMHDELNTYQGFALQASPFLISGRLEGRQVALVDKLGVDDILEAAIRETVAKAGGSVSLVITLAGPEVYESPPVAEALAQLYGLPAEPGPLIERTMAEVAGQLATASNPALLQELDRLGVIHFSGELAGPVSAAVMVADAEGDAPELSERYDLPLIAASIGFGFQLVGVGTDGAAIPVLESYRRNGISTVAGVDTIPGQVALVMVLEGKTGSYGPEGFAERLLPVPAGL